LGLNKAKTKEQNCNRKEGAFHRIRKIFYTNMQS